MAKAEILSYFEARTLFEAYEFDFLNERGLNLLKESGLMDQNGILTQLGVKAKEVQKEIEISEGDGISEMILLKNQVIFNIENEEPIEEEFSKFHTGFEQNPITSFVTSHERVNALFKYEVKVDMETRG